MTRNAPAILTATAVAGVATTAYLTGAATFKAAEIINHEESIGGTAADFKQRVKERTKLVWTLYIPATVVGISTIALVIAANRVSSKQTAAAMGLYTLSERAFQEYKDKVVEHHGANKEQKIRDEVAQDRVNQNPPKDSQVIFTGKGEYLCYETITGRYFRSDIESVRQSENKINQRILHDMYVSLNDFFREIGLESTGYGEMVGWNTDHLLEVQYTTVLSPDGEPALSLGYSHLPDSRFQDLI